MCKRSIKRGFTLIEVLVVVAIIALLVAILVPSLSAARRRAQTIACGANLKTTGMAMLYYTQANKDYYPSSGQWCELVAPMVKKLGGKKYNDADTISSPDRIEQVVEFLKCPGDVKQENTQEVWRRWGGEYKRMSYRTSYAINTWLCFNLRDVAATQRGSGPKAYAIDPPVERTTPEGVRMIFWAGRRTADDKRPSDVVMLTDAGDDDLYAPASSSAGVDAAEGLHWDFDDENDNIRLPGDKGQLEVHHKTGNNFLFVDQHVDYMQILHSRARALRGVPSFPFHWIPINGMAPYDKGT